MSHLFAKSNPADEILPGLWLGNRAAALDPAFLSSKHILAVFNCTKEIPFEPAVQRRYRVPVDDNLQDEEIRNLERWSYEIVFKIAAEYRKAREEGGGILVHCAAGMQRSAASMAMYLIASQNLTADQSIQFIRSKRPIAFFPAANFERAIRGFESSYNREIRPQISTAAASAGAPKTS